MAECLNLWQNNWKAIVNDFIIRYPCLPATAQLLSNGSPKPLNKFSHTSSANYDSFVLQAFCNHRSTTALCMEM